VVFVIYLRFCWLYLKVFIVCFLFISTIVFVVGLLLYLGLIRFVGVRSLGSFVFFKMKIFGLSFYFS